MNRKSKFVAILASGLTTVLSAGLANAQQIIEEQTRVNVVPRVIERQVISRSSGTGIVNDAMLPRRSNYSKRLGDILEQLSFAHDRGWLSDAQYADLRNWEASVAMEELVLREKGLGIVPRADVEQMERHLNGLAYTVNRDIDQGSRVANSGLSPM